MRELIHNLRLDLAGRATGLTRSGNAYGTRATQSAGAAATAERKPSFFASLLGLIGK